MMYTQEQGAAVQKPYTPRWTPEEDEVLLSLWNAHTKPSAAYIGLKLGKTRNAILGRISRLRQNNRQKTRPYRRAFPPVTTIPCELLDAWFYVRDPAAYVLQGDKYRRINDASCVVTTADIVKLRNWLRERERDAQAR